MKKTNMRFSLVCMMALGVMLSGTSAQGNALTHYVYVRSDTMKPK